MVVEAVEEPKKKKKKKDKEKDRAQSGSESEAESDAERNKLTPQTDSTAKKASLETGERLHSCSY